MDLNDARSVITLVSFLTFVGIVIWAWSGRRKHGFEEAAMLPFADDVDEPAAQPPAGAAAQAQQATKEEK